MAHWYGLLFLLAAMTTQTWSIESKENYFETCWPRITDCMSGGMQGGSFMNQCRLRCQCLGRRSGLCRRTRCSKVKAGYAYICECQGTLTRYHSLLLDLCEQ